MRFEWDEENKVANWLKHRIDFELAATVFSDPLALMRPDRVADGEERWMFIGHTPGGKLLVVIHTIRSEEVTRIISARKATPDERRDSTKDRHEID